MGRKFSTRWGSPFFGIGQILWTFQWGGKVCEDRLELKMCVTDLVRAVAQHLRVDAFILSWPGDFVVSSEVIISSIHSLYTRNRKPMKARYPVDN